MEGSTGSSKLETRGRRGSSSSSSSSSNRSISPSGIMDLAIPTVGKGRAEGRDTILAVRVDSCQIKTKCCCSTMMTNYFLDLDIYYCIFFIIVDFDK